jgi:hypothetical protein
MVVWLAIVVGSTLLEESAHNLLIWLDYLMLGRSFLG